jgi:hypothetical protein
MIVWNAREISIIVLNNSKSCSSVLFPFSTHKYLFFFLFSIFFSRFARMHLFDLITDTGSSEHYLAGNIGTGSYEQQQQQQHAAYEQKMRAQIQAVHAQSPRTVQRNVDQITTEIKINCDLRKSISFNGSLPDAATALDHSPLPSLDESDVKQQQQQQQPLPASTTTTSSSSSTAAAAQQQLDSSMDCEYQEPMERMLEDEVEEEVEVKEEPPFELPEGDINPFDKDLIAGLLRRMKFPRPHHAIGYVKRTSNLIKFVPSSTVTLGKSFTARILLSYTRAHITQTHRVRERERKVTCTKR